VLREVATPCVNIIPPDDAMTTCIVNMNILRVYARQKYYIKHHLRAQGGAGGLQRGLFPCVLAAVRLRHAEIPVFGPVSYPDNYTDFITLGGSVRTKPIAGQPRQEGASR
jgi:hypothetical protein